jgi:hypothetical protein
MITSEQVANMRKSLGKTVEMKVGTQNVTGKWSDIQLDTKTGLVDGVYIGEKLYRLEEIDYLKTL